jgi:hypothetical protein
MLLFTTFQSGHRVALEHDVVQNLAIGSGRRRRPGEVSAVHRRG